MPYSLQLFPSQKAEIMRFVDDVAPLSRVEIANVSYDFRNETLSSTEDMQLKFMTETVKKLGKVAPEAKF